MTILEETSFSNTIINAIIIKLISNKNEIDDHKNGLCLDNMLVKNLMLIKHHQNDQGLLTLIILMIKSIYCIFSSSIMIIC